MQQQKEGHRGQEFLLQFLWKGVDEAEPRLRLSCAIVEFTLVVTESVPQS